MMPPEPSDSRNTVMEIRAGTGGDEAALFAAELARCYQRYADSQGWKVEPMSSSATERGGLREVAFLDTAWRANYYQPTWLGHEASRLTNGPTRANRP
jgi:peptide chain release factor 1